MWVEKLSHFLFNQFYAHQDIIMFIVFAMVGGFIAQMIMPGKGFGMGATIAVGIVGYLIGKYYIVQHVNFTDSLIAKHLISGTAGSLAISIPLSFVNFKKRIKDKTKYRNNT